MEIHIGNRVADVTLVSKEDNKVRLNVDGRIYDVDIAMAENGSCSILHDGNSYNTEVIRGEGGKSYDVNLFYRSYHVDIADTQVKYLRMRKGGEERQDDKIIAPMPGKVQGTDRPRPAGACGRQEAHCGRAVRSAGEGGSVRRGVHRPRDERGALRRRG